MTCKSLARLLVLLVIFGESALALQAADQKTTGTRRVLIICGHPGDEAHHRHFAETIDRLRQGLIQNLHVQPDQISLQFGAEPIANDPGMILTATGRSTREEIESNVARIREELQPDDSLWVIVIGHAHYDGRHAHFNLPGPDFRSDEFAKLFTGIACQEQVFFLTCPVSGYFIKSLTAPNRIVITATEDDLEVNETICAAALADVLSNPPTRQVFDADQDDKLTLFDLYIVLVRRVIERYTQEMLVVTEHALLDDNGDGRGSEAQIDYLTEEQGGRWKAGTVPAKPKRDGLVSSKVPLTIQLPAAP